MIGWALIGACVWAVGAGMVTGDRWLRIGGVAGIVAVYALALALDWWWSRNPNPLVEVDADPFAEIDYLDWDFPPLVHEEERAA